MHTFLAATSSQHRPAQVALAIALGIGIGCCAHSPLLLAAGLVALYMLPVHLLVGVTSALVAFGVCSILHPQGADAVGMMLLRYTDVAQWLTVAYQVPLFPLLRLNSTSVLGELAIGLAQAPATFFFSWILLRRTYPASRVVHSGVLTEESACTASCFEYLDVEPTQEATPATRSEEPVVAAVGNEPPDVGESVPIDALSCGVEECAPPKSAQRVTSFLESCSVEDVDRLTTQQIANRAAELAEMVDEMLQDMLTGEGMEEEHNSSNVEGPHHRPVTSPHLAWHAGPPLVSSASEIFPGPGTSCPDEPTGAGIADLTDQDNHPQPLPPVPGELPAMPSATPRREKVAASIGAAAPGKTATAPSGSTPLTRNDHEEALRHLLAFLKQLNAKERREC